MNATLSSCGRGQSRARPSAGSCVSPGGVVPPGLEAGVGERPKAGGGFWRCVRKGRGPEERPALKRLMTNTQHGRCGCGLTRPLVQTLPSRTEFTDACTVSARALHALGSHKIVYVGAFGTPWSTELRKCSHQYGQHWPSSEGVSSRAGGPWMLLTVDPIP